MIFDRRSETYDAPLRFPTGLARTVTECPHGVGVGVGLGKGLGDGVGNGFGGALDLGAGAVGAVAVVSDL